MVHNNMDDVLDHLRMIKNRSDVNVDKAKEIEILEVDLRFLRTFIKYHHVLLPNSAYIAYKIQEKALWIRILLDSVYVRDEGKIRKMARLIGRVIRSFCCGNVDKCKINFDGERVVWQLLQSSYCGRDSRYNIRLTGSCLSEYMDCLDENLNDVPRYLVRSNPFFMKEIKILQKTDRFLKQVKTIQKKMKFLRYLYATEINSYVDHEKLEGLETRIQLMADNVGQFCIDLWVNEDEPHDDWDDDDDDDTYSQKDEANTTDIKNKPSYLLCLIVLVQLEMQKIFRDELQDSKFSRSRTFKNQKFPKHIPHHLRNVLVYLRNNKLKKCPIDVSSRNIDAAIEFLLVFLAEVPNRYINGNRLNEIFIKVGALVGDILCLIQKFLPGSAIDDDTSVINLGSMQILEKIEDLKEHVEERRDRSLKFIPSYFPTVGGLTFLDSFIRKLNEMKSELGSDLIIKYIVILEKELSSLTAALKDVAKVHHEREIYKDLRQCTVNLAYKAEIAIDSILAQSNGLWHLFCSLPAIIKELEYISGEVRRMWSENLSPKLGVTVETSKHLPTQHRDPINDEDIVGFENDAEEITQYLTRGTNELDVIPIVGMGGQGKTTFARKLYNDEKIVSRFDIRAWCCISQTYSRRELLQEILDEVSGSKDKVDKVDELADKLRKRLMYKRYLIVLDDMWEVMAWDDLRLSFPDVENGSRIIVTTRLGEVCKQIKRHTDPYSLPFLSPEESQELLQKKVFQNEGCPPELDYVSLAVAERCKGLPLVIVLVAGILKRNKMQESWWHKVKGSLLFYLGESEDYSQLTMLLSYDNLSDHLRPCLLYMGMFPEDKSLQVSKLIQLWIAEGFVQNIESGRLEEAAEGYLNDLVSSNLVMVAKRWYDGKVKYCQVHDLVLNFCLEKSREERFMSAVDDDYIHFQHLYINENRLCYHTTNEPSKSALLLSSKTWKHFHQHMRSLIIYARADLHLIPWITKLRLLKILDLRTTRLSLASLHPLIHLKYLAADVGEFDFNPESHLCHLETVIVKTSLDVLVPANFWKLEKLRHVDINNAIFDISYLENNGKGIFEESSKLENLRVLRTCDFSQ